MSSTITVRVDEAIKKEANDIFKEVGLDMSSAINVYLRQVIKNKGIPFALTAEVPNSITLKAIQEAEEGDMASFSTIDELMEDLDD